MSSQTPAILLGGAADLPRHEVERLLMAATGLDRAGILLTGALPDEEVHRFEALVARRRAGEPLQYLEATVDFGPVTLRIDHRALIPRPETERLWELATELLGVDDVKVIVDLCTGSGNLALACARHWPGARVLATDRSTAAAALARENADALALPVEVLVGDLFDPLPPALAGRVDLLVANPPYLSEAELEQVPAEVLAEPRDALVAGPDGIEVVARIGAEAGRWLGPEGIALVEVSEHHAGRAAALFAGLDATVCHDLTGRPRFVVARRPGEER
ncbi:MAG TPA: peptide chain release factor N(5)-glutamine methyltransferase [Acidimicrobiia bacterium]